MNPQIRVLLWVALGFLLYLNVQAWMKDHATVARETPTAAPADGAPQASPARVAARRRGAPGRPGSGR